ncbi:unnamed protein product [Polarella glacialis]|uniref:GRF-type domain-containing protein n=1 Tax=Polarella glacialis TaxID=89957 RepID=A0A813JBD1_POLGL|nr:unnamed protein product [Polarella glacialis]
MKAPLCFCSHPGPCVKQTAGAASRNAGKDYWCCAQWQCHKFAWADQVSTTLSAPGPPCWCGMPTAMVISGTAKNPNRPYWRCASTSSSGCSFFKWETEDWQPPQSPQRTPDFSPGHKCGQCKKPVEVKVVAASNNKGNAGRRYYKCVCCDKFDFLTDAAPTPPPTAQTPGSVEYVVDEITRRQLQELFHIPFGAELGTGRDNRERSTPYDYLHVECAWRVANPQRQKRFKDFCRGCPRGEAVETALWDAQEKLMTSASLRDRPLDHGSNQVLLLHGTKPEHLYDILFEGLDPKVSHKGLFGRGTYLAEDAAKVDQYLTMDAEWRGSKPEHELHQLHKQLYERGVKHGNQVFYALVCRVALGKVLKTKDGKTRNGSSKRVFKDSSKRVSKLAGGATSLLAELGCKIRRFREFVVFEPAAICIEYLVALKRVHHYCTCGEPAAERTVTKQTENFGRAILVCSKPQGDPKNCGFIQMLPQCYCGRSAGIATKRDGEKYYRCGATKDWCDFRDWNGPGGRDPGSKRSR